MRRMQEALLKQQEAEAKARRAEEERRVRVRTLLHHDLSTCPGRA